MSETMEAAPAPEAAVADSAPELSLGEIIRQASEGKTAEEITGGAAPERARDASGRFAATNAPEGETAAEEVSTDQPTPPAEEPEIPAIQPPQAWSGPEKEVFASLPREAQDAILRRERDMDRALQDRAAPLKDYQAIQDILAPFAAQYRVQGYTDADAIRMWATVAGELRRDPANAIRELARSHGLTLEQITGQTDHSQTQPAAPTDAVMRELRDLRARLEERDQRDQQAQATSVAANIEKFAADPKHQHFEAVRVHMGALMQQGLATDMEDAYQQAIWANPQVREKVLAEQNAAADAKRLADAKAKAEAARKAANPVRGAPPVSNGVVGATGNRSIRQEIEAAIAALS